MTYLFKIELNGCHDDAYWFTAKEKYLVRIDTKTKKANCTCMAGTFKESGKKQENCKHIIMACDLLKSRGRLKCQT